MIRLFSAIFISAFYFSSSVHARPLPWDRSSESSWGATPWGVQNSESRKERREEFFRSLEAAESPLPAVPVEWNEEASVSETQNEKLDQLPWKRYESEAGESIAFQHSFYWPVSGGKISSGFGVRGASFHEGIDIRAPMGTVIKAAAAGRVVYSGSMPGYGQTLVIYHGDGYSTVYAHQRSNLRRVGDIVKQGDAVAEVGMSGKTSGPHLHFEVRRRGQPVNPLSYSYARHPTLAER
jgi:murein DD-endopeptidase MepM/ murein hydrolase activator NlpD